MKIYENLISKVAKEFIKKAINSNYLVISKQKIRAAERDIESIFTSYLEKIREINQKTKDRISRAEELDNSSFAKVRKQIAAEDKVALEKNNEPFLVKQMLSLTFNTENIDDVMVDDDKLVRLFLNICKKSFISDEDLDLEIKKRLFYFPEVKDNPKRYKEKFNEIKMKLEIAKGLRNASQTQTHLD